MASALALRIFTTAKSVIRNFPRSSKRLRSIEPACAAQLDVAGNYQWLRRYADEKSALARTLAIKPNNAVTKVLLACVEFDSKADAKPFRQTIDSIQATNPAAVPSIVFIGFFARWPSATRLPQKMP
jgi:hypothetical protein